MKARGRIVVITLALLVVLLVSAAPVAAKATRAEYWVTEAEQCVVTDPGTWTFLPSGGVHYRGMVLVCHESIPGEPRVTGTGTIVANANLDATGAGPTWATFTLVTDEGGVWVGTMEGQLSAPGVISYHNVGHGQGIYEGQTFWGDVTPAGMHTVILNPHGD